MEGGEKEGIGHCTILQLSKAAWNYLFIHSGNIWWRPPIKIFNTTHLWMSSAASCRL